MEQPKIIVTPDGDKILVQFQELHDEYINPGFTYSLRSIQAVIDLVNSRGSQDNTFIFYDDETEPRIEVILDDTKAKRNQDKATYRFEISDLYNEWKTVLDKPIDQKLFIEFLKKRDSINEIPDAQALLASLQQLKMASQVEFDGEYDDRNNYTFAIKVRDMEGNTKLPNSITIHIPLLNESDFMADIELDLLIEKPKDAGDKPLFLLHCPLMHRYMKDAISHEIGKLKEALPGYHILAGSPK